MCDPTLTRYAGPVALVAGGLFAALDLARLPIALADDRTAALVDPVVRTANAAYSFVFCGLVITLVALHGRQADRAGGFGVLAFCAAVVGTMAQGGNMWFDGFASPWVAEVAPQAFAIGPTAILETGALLSYTLIALGWVLFGVAALRARVFPAVLAVALAVGGLLAFNSGMPPFGVPLGLAVAVLGAWLVRSDRTARRTVPAAG
jgi:hypothetical protein